MRIHSALILLFATTLWSCNTNMANEKDKPFVVEAKPNVLFISIDDLRPALGAYGDSFVVSPNLDAFASRSTTFREAYCQSAVCAPSRASLMTGLRPDSTRVWHLGDKFREIHPDITTMPQHFKKYGYRTVNIGKIFHNYMPDSISWDEPDLRPKQYLKPEWLKRDGETFYVNKETNRKQKIKRDKTIEKRHAITLMVGTMVPLGKWKMFMTRLILMVLKTNWPKELFLV